MPGKPKAANAAFPSFFPAFFRQKSLGSARDDAARKHRLLCCSLLPTMFHPCAGAASWAAAGRRGQCQCLEHPLLLIKEGYVPFPRWCTTHGARMVLAFRAGLHFSLVAEQRDLHSRAFIWVHLPFLVGRRSCGFSQVEAGGRAPLLVRCPLPVVACLPLLEGGTQVVKW